MTRRVLLVGTRFRKALARLGIEPGTDRARAVGRTLASLAETATLPAPHDTEVSVPPASRAFVRRVQGRNLWIWFRIVRGIGGVEAFHITSDPPVARD